MPKKRLTTEEFIQRAKQIHSDKYDYSKVIYINSHTKVCIICPMHREFWQVPFSHKHGHGCPKCMSEKIRNKFLADTADFIQKAKQVHSNMYDYSKVIYINSTTKVCIVCKKHGEFWQTPASHLQQRGCPLCRTSHGEQKIINFLLDNNINFEYQKTFEDCIGNKWKLPFDFYLPEINTCIEFDGKQHFNKNSKYYSKELIKNDKLKNEYCKQHNIRLIRIPYWEESNISKILILI